MKVKAKVKARVKVRDSDTESTSSSSSGPPAVMKSRTLSGRIGSDNSFSGRQARVFFRDGL